MIQRRAQFQIPSDELSARTTRSSGAGGQHVNKTASRVQLSWNVAQSAALNDDQRARLTSKLASRLTGDGTLTVNVSDTRSQHRNREIAEQRINEVVRQALIVPKKRKATRPTKAAKETRLKEKKIHSLKKRRRQAGPDD
jgi:Protein chain release factor B